MGFVAGWCAPELTNENTNDTRGHALHEPTTHTNNEDSLDHTLASYIHPHTPATNLHKEDAHCRVDKVRSLGRRGNLEILEGTGTGGVQTRRSLCRENEGGGRAWFSGALRGVCVAVPAAVHTRTTRIYLGHPRPAADSIPSRNTLTHTHHGTHRASSVEGTGGVQTRRLSMRGKRKRCAWFSGPPRCGWLWCVRGGASGSRRYPITHPR